MFQMPVINVVDSLVNTLLVEPSDLKQKSELKRNGMGAARA